MFSNFSQCTQHMPAEPCRTLTQLHQYSDARSAQQNLRYTCGSGIVTAKVDHHLPQARRAKGTAAAAGGVGLGVGQRRGGRGRPLSPCPSIQGSAGQKYDSRGTRASVLGPGHAVRRPESKHGPRAGALQLQRL